MTKITQTHRAHLYFTPDEQEALLKDYKLIEVKKNERIYGNIFGEETELIAEDSEKRQYTIAQAVNREIIKRLLGF